MFQIVTSGTIAAVGEAQQGTSAKGPWMFQTFVLEQKNDKYTDNLAFEVWGEKALEEKNLQRGDFIKVTLNISSREFNGRWYTSCRAQSVDKGQQPTAGDFPNPYKGTEKYQGKPQPKPIENEKDDLPF